MAARKGRIVWVGPERDLDRYVAVAEDAVEVDAEGAAVLPGFVDPHTHAVFAGSRAGEYGERLRRSHLHRDPRRGGGINATVVATRAATRGAAGGADATAPGFVSSAMARPPWRSRAATAWRWPTNSRCSLRPLWSIRLAGCVRFLGAHAVPDEFCGRADDYVELVCSEMLPALRGEAEFVDVFCDAGAFTVEQSRRVLLAARGLGYEAQDPRRGARALRRRSAGRRSRLHIGRPSGARHLGGDRALQHAAVVAVALPGTSFCSEQPMRRRAPSWRRASRWPSRPTSIREPATARTCRWSSLSLAWRCT